MDQDFLSEEECVPNMNSCHLAGKLQKLERLTGKAHGLRLQLGYTKHWPNGKSDVIPLTLYVTKPYLIDLAEQCSMNEILIAQGEVTDKSSIYCHFLQRWHKPEREPGADDEFLAAMEKYGKR